MRKNFGAKPFIYPQPVLIIGTYQDDGTPNAMNAAWGSIADYGQVAIYLADHNTTRNIFKRKGFTVSMATVDTVVACDYVGVVSADKEPNKIEKAGWHAIKSEMVDAPYFEELPLTLECEMVSFDEESELLVGEIKNVCADESILSEDGKIDPLKLKPITYDPVNHKYIALGDVVGNAFKDGLKLK